MTHDSEAFSDLGGLPSIVTPPDMLRGCGKDCRLDSMAHGDGHVCPWREVGGKAWACGCVHPKPGEAKV